MANCDFSNEEMVTIFSYLSSFNAISVRESYAQEFLNKFGIKAETVIDAVFLLEKKDYLPIISDRFKNKKYVLLYLPAQDNEKLRLDARTYAKNKGLELIEINNKVVSKKGLIGDAGVEDFLSAIFYADSVFTNSFHALCFSAIFHKNFYIYSRLASGKLTDFCKILGLENRFINDDKLYNELPPIDYDLLDNRIDAYRLFSQKWLLDSLDNVSKEFEDGK